MFDLFRSRDKAVRILLGVVLGIVAISMVSYLIPGAPGGAAAANDQGVIAKIGDERVTTQTALQAISSSMQGRKIPQQMIGYFAPQVVESLINQRALAYEAKRLGIRVSDDEVAAAVRAQLPANFIDKDGKVKEDMLNQALSANNATLPDYLDDVRRTLLVERLQALVKSGVVVTNADLQRDFRTNNEKVKIDYVLIKPAQVDAEVQITPADIDAYYKKNKATYNSPEKRSVAVVLIDQTKIESAQQPTEADLQSTYNASLDRFRTPERVRIRHILIATDATTTDAQAKTKAEDVLKQLKAGGDFADLAKKYSKDPGSAAKGGDLDWVARGQMVKPFEDAAFSLKTGDTSGLVKTTYGYHILQVQGREEARVKPFAEVRDTLAGEWRKRKAADSMQQLADRASNALKRDPAHPEKAAAEVNGDLVRADNIKPSDPLPQIGINPELQNAITGLKANGVTAPVSIPAQNKIAIAEVTGYTAAHPAPLDEVRAQVESALRREKDTDMVAKRASDLVAKAKANGGNLTEAAKSLRLEVKTSSDFNRRGAVEGFGSASLLGDAFSAKDGAIVGPVDAADGKAVVKVVSHTPADMSPFASQQATLRDELREKLGRERLALFEDGIRKQLEKDGKIRVQQDNLNRLLQGMRS